MVKVRLALGGRISLALAGAYVYDRADPVVFRLAKYVLDLCNVFTVYRSEVMKSELLEEILAYEDSLYTILQPARALNEILSDSGHRSEQLLRKALKPEIPFAGAYPGEMAGIAADIAGNRHSVIVKHDNQIVVLCAVIKRLVSHSAGKRSVAYHRDGAGIAARQLVRGGKAHRRRHRRGGVSAPEGVAIALRPLLKTGYSAVGAQRSRYSVLPAGDYFMYVALMAYIENNSVMRTVEHAVQCQSKLYHSQIRGEMPSALRRNFYKKFAYLRRKHPELLRRQSFYVLGRINIFEYQDSFPLSSSFFCRIRRARARRSGLFRGFSPLQYACRAPFRRRLPKRP